MMNSFHKILVEIQENQDFERLEALKDPTLWSKLQKEESELFSSLLMQYGSQLLSKGDYKVVENFELAAQVMAHSSSILFQQGLIFASYHQNSRCLHLACQAFAKAVASDPDSFIALYTWAETLLVLGLLDGELECFIEGNNKFCQASHLLNQAPEEVNKGEFYWKWGLCCASLGKHSGEPVDFHQAICHYRVATDLGCDQTQFFNDYGHALVDLAALLDKPELFAEALKWFSRAVQQEPNLFETWYNRASCLLQLIENNPQEEWFEQAALSFQKAVELNPQHSQTWLRWGQLEANLGKLKRNQKILESSLERFTKAHELESDHPIILTCWGEVELFLGAYLDRLDLLQSAKNKIIKSLEIQPENVEGWYLYGACLNELGRYFEEENFYHQAIEKFQYGLSLSPRHSLLYYGLALSYYALGEMNEDLPMFEKAAQQCSNVIDCGGGTLAQFWNDWGVALLKLAEMTEQQSYVELAIEKFEQALKHPNLLSDYEDADLEWIYNYGCAFDLLGDFTEDSSHFEKAIRILGHVVQVDPSYTHARYNLALALFHLGDAMCDIDLYYKAVEHFQVLVENECEDGVIHLDFGVCLIHFALLVQDVHHPEPSQVLLKKAEAHLVQAALLGNCQAHYQLAGLYSISSHYSLAMYYMERAQYFGELPAIEDILHDEWLEGLRQIPSFRHFINQLSSQNSKEDK